MKFHTFLTPALCGSESLFTAQLRGFATAITSAVLFPEFEQRILSASSFRVIDQPTRHAACAASLRGPSASEWV